MRRTVFLHTAIAFLIPLSFVLPAAAPAQVDKDPYRAMAPVEKYLSIDESTEIALARSAAPASVSSAAEVLVLRRQGYASVAKGSNGFVCIVVRSWANTTDNPQFWNPRMRAPHCFNAAAARTFLPFYLMKSRLVLSGKSKAEVLATLTAAMENEELPTLAAGTMVYMMSRQQYLNDEDMAWHPHLMFFAPGDARKSWGANLPGSPVMAAYDPEQRVTTFFILTDTERQDRP